MLNKARARQRQLRAWLGRRGGSSVPRVGVLASEAPPLCRALLLCRLPPSYTPPRLSLLRAQAIFVFEAPFWDDTDFIIREQRDWSGRW